MSKDLIANLRYKKPKGFDPHKLSKMLDEAYLSGRRENKFTKKTTFSPSTIGYGHGTCARYWFIAFDGTEFNEKFTSLSIANMSNGTSAHDRIQKIFEKTGIVKELEREMLKDSPPVRGFADVVVDWDGKEIIGEIKTTKDEAFLFRQNSMEPSKNHLLQILMYMDIAGADEGFVLYENKNTQEILIIPVNMNDRNRKFLDEVYEWMNEVHGSWKERTLPNRPFRKNNTICQNCPVKDTCFEMGDGDISIPVLKL